MRWEGYVARMGEEKKLYKVLSENPKERDHREDQGVGGKMESECILGRSDWIRLPQDRDRWRAVVSVVI
jgi:hypothetical protein